MCTCVNSICIRVCMRECYLHTFTHALTIPEVEDVQDMTEKILIEEGHAKVAKAFILYRQSHEELRDVKGLFDTIEAVDDYIGLNDWMVK